MLIATKWPLPLDPPGQGSETAGTRGLCSRSPPRRPACRPVAQKLGSRLRGRFSPSLVPRAPPPSPLAVPAPGQAGGPRSAQSAAPAPWCPRVSLTERPGGFCVRGLHPALGAPEREVADSSAPAACHRSPPGTERGLSEGPFGPRQFGLLVQCGGHCF